jgi:hypothetical protein
MVVAVAAEHPQVQIILKVAEVVNFLRVQPLHEVPEDLISLQIRPKVHTKVAGMEHKEMLLCTVAAAVRLLMAAPMRLCGAAVAAVAVRQHKLLAALLCLAATAALAAPQQELLALNPAAVVVGQNQEILALAAMVKSS